MNRLLCMLLLVSSPVLMAADIEEPRWELIDKLDQVELRRYAPSIQAVTELGSSAGTSSGFRILAGYIFGGNERAQSIAMTAPVQETLEKTRPVMALRFGSEPWRRCGFPAGRPVEKWRACSASCWQHWPRTASSLWVFPY